MLSHSRGLAGAILGLHAQTSLHAGAGTALGTVDLPIQREQHTHWPLIAGSSLKGVLRDAYRESLLRAGLAGKPVCDSVAGAAFANERERADALAEVTQVFGPPTSGAHEFGGAVSVSDARLLAFPVRSLGGVFAWVSCPAVLERLQRDLAMLGSQSPFDAGQLQVQQDGALVPEDCPCVVHDEGQDFVALEEFEFLATKTDLSSFSNWVVEALILTDPAFQSTANRIRRQLLIISDDRFSHFVQHATEVVARIALDYETKTVRRGLFYQEFLPPETLLYSMVFADAPRSRRTDADANAILAQLVERTPAILQIGGDETTGKGLCAARIATNGGAG